MFVPMLIMFSMYDLHIDCTELYNVIQVSSIHMLCHRPTVTFAATRNKVKKVYRLELNRLHSVFKCESSCCRECSTLIHCFIQLISISLLNSVIRSE